ncbi:DcaP family trimeric outer membrane transporter [Palleronia sp. LCG004]|uniref:DcaP family trimeric outer membrane transporter n=1 Tax=Palleronia sp. LCG004 TaxID=3079304 RepID=UPI002942F8E2|nr:DcaP family trimeric outer membrane transporter [Palleronia sp. LCG004]WOI56952.1 DcaP family trimeric outer membrane transporter [Palleronia sp. LCG004]
MNRTFPAALGAVSLAALTAGQASAQSDADRIAALEQRIATLEQSSEPLSFNDESGTTVELYGYFKTDFIYDFGYELGNTTFGLVGMNSDDDGDFFNATVNQTRLGFRTTTDTAFGELGSQVEVDLYGGDNAFSTGDADFRLRHANLTLNGLRVGQYWTSFMPLSSYPVTLDFQGVAGIPFARQEQISYEFDITGNFVGEVAVEESNGDSDDPVLIGAFGYDTDPLLLRASAIFGNVNNATGGTEDVYGVNLSTTADLWEGAQLNAAYTYGEGIASYLVFLGDDLDANGDAIEVQSAYIGISQTVGEDLTLRAIYGYRENETGTADATKRLSTLHLNAEYSILENTSIGAEYFHGTRDSFDGGSYDVDRIQTSLTFEF